MKNLILALFVLLIINPLYTFADIPTGLQNKIDKTSDVLDTKLDEIQSLIDDAQDPDTEVNQKDANKALKQLKGLQKRANKTIKAIRKRLKQLFGDFDADQEEIKELQDWLEHFKDQVDNIKASRKDIKDVRPDLDFPDKKIQKLLDDAEKIELTFMDLEEDLCRVIDEGAQEDDGDLAAFVEDGLKDIKKTEKAIKARLNKLFGNLKKTTEIKALQKALKAIRKAKKKYKKAKKALKDIEPEPTDPNTVTITKNVGAGIVCVFDGHIQESGFGTATFTCTYPEAFNNGRLTLTAIDPDNGGVLDYGFAAINFGTITPQTLRIDPCPTSLPVCEEAVKVVRAVKNTSATLGVFADGDPIATVNFIEGQ